jgi:hypothetical protein
MGLLVVLCIGVLLGAGVLYSQCREEASVLLPPQLQESLTLRTNLDMLMWSGAYKGSIKASTRRKYLVFSCLITFGLAIICFILLLRQLYVGSFVMGICSAYGIFFIAFRAVKYGALLKE